MPNCATWWLAWSSPGGTSGYNHGSFTEPLPSCQEVSQLPPRAQPVRGMRDAVPPTAELRRQLANRILDVYASYGYEPIDTPALEDLDVLLGSQAGENEKLIFKVLKRGARLEAAASRDADLADLGLRFDLTVPLARFVASHRHELPMPLKVAHIGPVWRAERPQRGRYREFIQCDIDIVGEPSIAAEVELCTATVEALERVGIRGSTVRLNDRRLLRATVENHLGPAEPAPVYIALDKLDKLGRDEVAAELVRGGHDTRAVQRLLDHLAEGNLGGPGQVEVDARRTLASLEALGIPARFDPTLVRGMGYYTGQIFELSHPDVPYSLAGGGRYDGLTARFGAQPLPMCGFSIGFERICEMVEPAAIGPARHKEVVACATDEELLSAMQEARLRRQRDPDLLLTVVRQARNVRKQREDFQRLGYSYSQE
jgi:histidyl-tRNA synthetase